MSFFQKIVETVQIDEENSIVVVSPTYGQVQAANGKMMKFGIDQNGKQGDVQFDMASMELELMAACIKEWSGPGFEGRPVTRENILALPSFVIDKVRPTVDRFTKGLTDTEKKA